MAAAATNKLFLEVYEQPEKEKNLNLFYSNYNTKAHGGLTAEQLQSIYERLRNSILSMPQVEASMKHVCSGYPDILECDEEELLDTLDEMDRRCFLAKDLQWEFAMLDRQGKGSIPKSDVMFLFKMVHGEYFSQHRFDRLMNSRIAGDSDVTFQEIEVELCDIPTYEWIKEKLEAEKKAKENELEEKAKLKEAEEKKQEALKAKQAKIEKRRKQEELKQLEEKRRKQQELERIEKEKKEQELLKIKQAEEERHKKEEAEKKAEEERLEQIEEERHLQEEADRLKKENEERLKKEEEDRLKKEGAEKLERAEEERRMKEEAEKKAEEEEERRLLEEESLKNKEAEKRKKEDEDKLAEEERKRFEEEAEKQKIKKRQDDEENQRKKDEARENWKKVRNIGRKQLFTNDLQALRAMKKNREKQEAAEEENTAESLALAEEKAERKIQKAEELLKNAASEEEKKKAEKSKARAVQAALENKEKRLRLQLTAAVKLRNRPKINVNVEEAKEAEIPALNPDIEIAEKVSDSLKCGEDLEDAMVKRDLTSIEEAVGTIKTKNYEKDHVVQLLEADKLMEKLRRLEKSKKDILELNQRTISEIRSYSQPIPAIHEIMIATYMILGYKHKELKEWKYIQALLGRTGKEGLKRMCTTLEASKIDLNIAKVVENKYLNKYSLEAITDISAGIGTFYKWSTVMIDEARNWNEDGELRRKIEEKRKMEMEEANKLKTKKKKKPIKKIK